MSTAAGPSVMATPSVRRHAPEPFYFGPDGSLFGVYHAAGRARARTVAIVLCQPLGHEYFRLHRAFRNIAVGLSRVGFPVLRFDYYGTGDSHGETPDAGLRRWQQDVGAAIDEVKRRSGAARVSLVGLRFGATLAWLECAKREDADLLVMWEPIVTGRTYLTQLREVEREWLADPARQAPPDAERDAGCLLGCPMSPELEREIGAVDLLAGPLPASAHVIALNPAADAPVDERWRDRLLAKYGVKSTAVLPSGADWADPAAIHTAVYAPAAIQVLPTLFDHLIV